MAYEGGYGGQQRPYGGQAPPRHAPRQQVNAPPQQYGASQQYDEYHQDYGYGSGRDFGGQRQDQNYGRGPPPQDQYGRGGSVIPGPRGGPIPRPQTADPHRGQQRPPRGGPMPGAARGIPNGHPGQGGIRPGPYASNSDPAARRHPMNTPPMSPRDGHFGHKHVSQERGRRPDIPYEQQMVDQMSNMDMNQRPMVPTNGRTSSDAQRSQGEYGRPPVNAGRGPPPRGYPQGGPPRQYPGYGAPDGYGNYNDGYNGAQEPPAGGFGPPARSRTMPVDDMRQRGNMPPPKRMDAMQYSTPAGRGIPHRPSTAGGHRAPPQRSYTAGPQAGPGGHYSGEYDDQNTYHKPSTASYDEVYDAYFDNQRNSHPEYEPESQHNRVSLPDFDAAPAPGQRSSFEQSMRPSNEQPQRGAHQTAVLNHAKSQPVLRQPQTAVFEMAGDVPDVPAVPPVPPMSNYQAAMLIKNNSSDQDSALRLAKKLVEAADVLAPKMPDPKQRTRARERYLIDCHKILKKLANAQNPDAMFLLADCLGRGLFGDSDHKEAFTQYQSAAKLGHPAAAYRTAVCCEIGHEEGGGTRKDPMKAIQWYKRAATLGDPPAMYKVGMILLKGLLGQPKNPREAVGWLKRAAERADGENPHALHELGLLYESAQPNDAIIRDEAYAYSLFLQAADLGYKFSQYRLGCAFEYGLLGCPIDPRQSIQWYSKAATQEEHQAELALSGWYLTGSEGVLGQSDTEAYLWARKAAIAGLAKAEYAMGYFTEVGIGVPPNLEDAKRWYWRAAAQDFPKARERLEDLKRGAGKNGARQRERISRSKMERQQEGDCVLM
ncbi:hypothetical protein FPRO05_10248 [Fusarium proliferatum]|uniref:Chitin synthase regulatory factor 3 n=1 Tax=Gibberella intermedia TaxID=948311 RepID=A0A365NCR5_GIBIN|nr:hypothetical protein FPRO05_10248 [Fusarium proliferatum]